jgi:hypothetical protein
MSIHICWSHGHYLGQIRPPGHRLWKTVTGKCKSKEAAIARAASAARGLNWKRLRVLFIDSNLYYGPSLVFEGKK